MMAKPSSKAEARWKYWRDENPGRKGLDKFSRWAKHQMSKGSVMNKPNGRPPVAEPKNKTVGMMVSAREKHAIQTMAAKAGLSESKHMRRRYGLDSELRVGRLVEIVSTAGDGLYFVGDRARLVEQLSMMTWVGDFTVNDEYTGNGLWSLEPFRVEVIEEPPTE